MFNEAAGLNAKVISGHKTSTCRDEISKYESCFLSDGGDMLAKIGYCNLWENDNLVVRYRFRFIND